MTDLQFLNRICIDDYSNICVLRGPSFFNDAGNLVPLSVFVVAYRYTLLTSPSNVFSNLALTIRAEASLSLATSLQLMMGVLIFLAALMISLIRGTPRVTFIEATPAKWKVFSVICVPGSPIDCAPTAPTVEPGSMRALIYFNQMESMKLHSWLSVTLETLSTTAFSAAKEKNRRER